MDFGAIFLLFVVSLAIALFIAWPFISNWHARSRGGQEVSSLLAERDRLLAEIQELDFDKSLGKITPEEYPQERKALLQKGTEVLRRLDALTPSSWLEKQVEQNISISLPGSPETQVDTPQFTDDDLEIMIANRRVARKAKTAGFCPRCGKPLFESDLFCASCGEPVKQSARGSAA